MANIMGQRRRRRERLPWHPAALPPPGFCLEHDGATFEAVVTERVSGTAWFVTWRTHCIDGGVEW